MPSPKRIQAFHTWANTEAPGASLQVGDREPEPLLLVELFYKTVMEPRKSPGIKDSFKWGLLRETQKNWKNSSHIHTALNLSIRSATKSPHPQEARFSGGEGQFSRKLSIVQRVRWAPAGVHRDRKGVKERTVRQDRSLRGKQVGQGNSTRQQGVKTPAEAGKAGHPCGLECWEKGPRARRVTQNHVIYKQPLALQDPWGRYYSPRTKNEQNFRPVTFEDLRLRVL